MSVKTKVSVIKCGRNPSDEEVDSAVRKAIELVGGIESIVSSGDRVLIKPNLVVARKPDEGVTTDPRICKTIADMIIEVGGKPIIAESSAVGINTEEAIKVAGYNSLREAGYEVIDLKKVDLVKVKVPKGKVLKEIPLPKIVVDSDVIISVAKMKTHDQAKVTLALKNMKGVVPDTYKRKFHTTLGVFQAVADLCTVVTPSLSVIDGIVAQEGLAPIYGTPVEMGLIIAGTDVVAVDAVTSVIMGFDPEEIEMLRIASELGLGTMNLNEIEVIGEKIESVKRRFKRADEAVFDAIKPPKGFELVFSEKACTGCRDTVLSSLFDMNAEGILGKAENTIVIAGKVDSLPKTNKRIVLVGNCLSKFKDYGWFVPGCPPNNKDVVSGILGEERESRWLEFGAKEKEGVT